MAPSHSLSWRPRWLWLIATSLLALIVLDLAQVALRVASYPSFLSWPGAYGYLAEAVAALAGYALIIVALLALASRVRVAWNALRVGCVIGLVGGCLEIVGIAAESLLALPRTATSAVTLAAMLTLFLLFALAGFIDAWRERVVWRGAVAAVWSAMVAITITVTFGFLLMSLALPTLARGMASDPEFVRSGWADPQAFAIANTLDAGFTHLTEAPIIAAVVGSLGAGLARFAARRYDAARA
ncbi:MAG TPA: hypothetical protein VF808_17320 [Ktedonobacterales bacterium]